MCRKVKLSVFISKRKCLINSKCYTKDSFSFTSPFISLKNALFPLLFCYHSTLRNTTCMLYQSAHPQIRLQPNIASPSLFKTNIRSLLPPCCSEDPTEDARILCRYLTASTAEAWVFFIGEPTEGWNVLDTGVHGRMGLPPVPPPKSLGCRVPWDQRPRSSLEHSSGQP